MAISRQNDIRVMHLIGSSGLYGAERWVLALLKGLEGHPVDSTLINLVDREGECSDVVLAAREKGFHAVDFHTGGKFNPFAAKSLAKLARKQRVDVIHGHGYKSDAIGLLAARLAGCRMISTPHGWSLEADRKLRAYENFDRSLFKFMDMVCPLSSDLATDIAKRSSRNLRMILNGVDLDEVDRVPPVCNQQREHFLIGYIGQLIERKDLKTLLAAVKLLSDRSVPVKLQIVGGGTEFAKLKEYSRQLGIEQIVDFTGFRSDAVSILKNFDVFVLPSLMEGIPRCIMEAMAARVPVIVSDIPGNCDLVTHGKHGLLFSPGDSSDLAERIMTMMQHPERAGEMAVMSRDRVETLYSNRRMAVEYLAAYRQLTGGQA